MVAIRDAIGGHRLRLRGVPEPTAAFEDIGEGMLAQPHRQCLPEVGRNEDVEVARVRGDAFYRSRFPPEISDDDSHDCTVIIDDFRYVLALDILVSRRRHLEMRGQV